MKAEKLKRELKQSTYLLYIILFMFFLLSLVNAIVGRANERMNDMDKELIEQQSVLTQLSRDMSSIANEMTRTTTTLSTTTTCKQTSKYSKADIELVTRVVIAEARGGSFKGQAAVAQVIYDRMHYTKADWGGPTIEGVVYRPNQFSSPTREDISNQVQARKAVEAVFLDGYRVFKDTALVFFNPKKSGKSNIAWARNNYKLLGKIDGHEFRGV